MSDLQRELQEKLQKQLRSSNLDLVDLIPIPVHGDRMVKLRTLQEALDDFDRSTESEETTSFLVQVRRARTEENPGPSLDFHASKAGSNADPDSDAAFTAAHAVFGESVTETDLPYEPEIAQSITARDEVPHQPKKPALDNIYLPNGKLNIPFLSRNAALLFSTGDFVLARNIYKAMLHSGEQAGAALLGIARCFQAEGKLEEARVHFEESIAYQPTLETCRLLSAVLMQQGKHANAAETLERALALKETPQRARFELLKAAGNCWTRANRPQEAEKAFNKALEIDPSADEVRSNLGVLHLQANRGADAKRNFQDALASNPSNAKALSGLASCLLTEGDKKAAHDLFAKSLEIELNNPTAIYHLVKIAYELKTHATAARILEEYVQSAPINPNLLYSLAGLQFHLGRMKESELSARQVLSMSPDHSGAKELLELIGKYSGEGTRIGETT